MECQPNHKRVSWKRGPSFLLHVLLVILAAVFASKYIDGRRFPLSHLPSIPQPDGTTITIFTALPTQSEVVTILNILASAARVSSILWAAAIDLHCIFLFLEKGGLTFQGLRTISDGWIPGIRQFRWKRNFVTLTVLHAILLGSSFFTAVLMGSITWAPSSLYVAGNHLLEGIPLARTGDLYPHTGDSTALDLTISTLTSNYGSLWNDAKYNSSTRSMHRLLSNTFAGYLPAGTTLDNLTIPYFAVDAFEWIRNPNSTLTPQQKLAVAVFNDTGPRIMNLERWGFIPDGNWGPYDASFPAPHTVAESRIYMISLAGTYPDSKCQMGPTVPNYVEPYVASLNNVSKCFIFANVAYRAGAARCTQCQVYGPNKIQNTGNFNNLKLINDSLTRVALSFVPYVLTTLVYSADGSSLPLSPTLQDQSIEMLSRSYQVTWSRLTNYGSDVEQSNVDIGVEASVASVQKWRVALWGSLHAFLLIVGLLFTYLNGYGGRQEIENPAVAAFLVDSTALQHDIDKLAGDTLDIQARRLEMEGENPGYIVIKRETRGKGDNEAGGDEEGEGEGQEQEGSVRLGD